MIPVVMVIITALSLVILSTAKFTWESIMAALRHFLIHPSTQPPKVDDIIVVFPHVNLLHRLTLFVTRRQYMSHRSIYILYIYVVLLCFSSFLNFLIIL